MRTELIKLAIQWLTDNQLIHQNNLEYLPAVKSHLKLTDKEVTEVKKRLLNIKEQIK